MLIAGVLLVGCGFQLRGGLNLGPEFARIHITGDDRDLVAQLSEALAQRGATVADSTDGAAVVAITASAFARAALTTDARGRASAYEITYRVEFTVAATTDGEAPPQAITQTIALNRAIDYDPARQLQSEAETRFLEDAMRREMAARIVNHLARR